LRLLGALPFAINRALATAVGTLLAWLPTQALKVSKTNLALCYPALSAEEQTRLARKSLLESVKNTFEIALFWRQPAEGLKRVVAVDGDTPLRQAVQDGRPIMILAPHLGCWEVLNFWLATEFGLHAMFAPSGLPEVDALVRSGREHFGSTMYPTTARGVAGLVRAMKKGALTAILPDQVPDRRSGRHVPFYGQPAYTGTLACKLIRQTQAVTFMAWARRLPGTQGYEIRVRPAADSVADAAKSAGFPPIGTEGENTGEWILVDLGDVIVHLMLPATREFYDLERLWKNPQHHPDRDQQQDP